jgi:hypothetical protein
MSASPKAYHLDDSRVPAPLRPALEIVATPAKLDFAANPNHYRTNGKVAKLKPRQRARGADLSPRLLLKLSLECETSQLLDPDFAE